MLSPWRLIQWCIHNFVAKLAIPFWHHGGYRLPQFRLPMHRSWELDHQSRGLFDMEKWTFPIKPWFVRHGGWTRSRGADLGIWDIFSDKARFRMVDGWKSRSLGKQHYLLGWSHSNHFHFVSTIQKELRVRACFIQDVVNISTRN